jgi:hypothetical protein
VRRPAWWEPIGVTSSFTEVLHYLCDGALTVIQLLEDTPADPPRGACPDAVLLARGQRPRQALNVHRADIAELRGGSHLPDRHGGLLVIIPEVVVDPYAAAVSLLLPVGVEVVDVVADPPFRVLIGDELTGLGDPVVKAPA